MHERDQQLVQSILSGSVDAWHQFVHEYGTLIQSVVRRHLFGDEDEIRTVFVQVLETLYKQSFATYEGRASLSTWTALVARGKTLDYVRAKLGRKRAPAAIEQLGPVDQGVFQYHFVEGLPLEAVSSRLASEGHHTTFEELLGSVEQVELHLDPHVRRRLAYGRRAASHGGTNGRLLEFADLEAFRTEEAHAAQQDDLPSESEPRPDLSALLDRLSREESEVLRLRYMENKTAKETATRLGLDGPRKVYSIADRALARLRRWTESEQAKTESGIGNRESTKKEAATKAKKV